MGKRHETDKRPTIAQIAEHVGVSVSTVSKVLNGRTDVSAATRERIEQYIETSGFVRNRAARALRKGRTGLIDLVVPNLHDDYFTPILHGVELALKEEGIRLVLTATHYQPEEEMNWFASVTDGSTDGIILVLPSDAFIEHLRQNSIPFVIIHNQGGLSMDTPSVRVTSWEGGFTATNYFISLGHTRIAYIGKNTGSIDAMERFAGYAAALERAGIPLRPDYQCDGEFSVEVGHALAHELMRLPEPPTAIFAGNDHMAAGVYQTFYELGRSIPGDLSVIGFDDRSYTTFMNPPLTTVRAPRQDMGRVAATMLLKLIDEQPLDSSTIILPTQLVVRGSCAPIEERVP